MSETNERLREQVIAAVRTLRGEEGRIYTCRGDWDGEPVGVVPGCSCYYCDPDNPDTLRRLAEIEEESARLVRYLERTGGLPEGMTAVY